MTSTPTTFLRLLAASDKAAALADSVSANRAGSPAADTYAVDPASFRQIPGSPFAYWVSEHTRAIFSEHAQMEGQAADVRFGLSTKDDTRFLRLWTEERPGNLGAEFAWVWFAKGGAWSPYYYDVHLVLKWGQNGEELKSAVSEKNRLQSGNPSWSRWISAVEYYFRPGLTYPRRTNGFSVRVMPAGCIFADKGPAIFVAGNREPGLFALLAVVNSLPFKSLLSLLLGRVELAQSFEVGLIQQMPVPDLTHDGERALAVLAREAHDRKRDHDRDDEVTHPFTVPALVRLLREHSTISAALDALDAEEQALQRRLAEIQAEIDGRCFALYGFSPEDRAQFEQQGRQATVEGTDDSAGERTEDEDEDEPGEIGKGGNGAARARIEAANLLMYALGCAFGRWDVRIGGDPSLAPPLADPFAPLPVCAPGALVYPDGLPATKERIASEAWLRARPDVITLPPEGSVAAPAITAGEYPLAVAWEGILADDPDAPNDVVRRVRAVFDVLFGERADAIEAEACTILGVRDLREYFRNPRLLFDFHIGRYSKSRRKAPIYWLLQSPRRSYAIWLYYHRLDADLLFKALTLHLLPKIAREERHLAELAERKAQTEGAEARRLGKEMEKQEALLADLREFHAALDRAAKHYLVPDLNDGVLLTIAPLCEVVPWKEAKNAWQQLIAGKYEWSSIGKQTREKGLVKAK